MRVKKPLKISEEDFSAWRDSVITEAVFAHLKEMAEAAEKAWLGHLRAETPVDATVLQLLQTEFKAKLEFIEDMTNIALEDIQEADETGRSNDGKFLAPRRREPAA